LYFSLDDDVSSENFHFLDCAMRIAIAAVYCSSELTAHGSDGAAADA